MSSSSPLGLLTGVALEATTPADASIDPAVDWVRRALDGDDDAFARIVHTFTPRLKLLLQRRLGACANDVDDVLQETFTKAFQSLRRYDSRYRFSTWLFTIGIRVAIDTQRRHKRWPWARATDAMLDQHPARPAVVSPMLETADCSQIGAFEESDLWQQAQTHLNQTQCTALWLRYAEEMPIEEIAKVLGKSKIGVRVLLHRARNCLLDRIDVRSDPTLTRTCSGKDAHAISRSDRS